MNVSICWQVEGIPSDGFGFFPVKEAAESSAGAEKQQQVGESCPGNMGVPDGFEGAVEVGCSEFNVTLIWGIFSLFSSSCTRHLHTGVKKAGGLISQGTFCTDVI